MWAAAEFTSSAVSNGCTSEISQLGDHTAHNCTITVQKLHGKVRRFYLRLYRNVTTVSSSITSGLMNR
jgi:hypothetical protein